eukprot:869903-Pyramimonas_sp.AAC.1
MGPLTGEGRRRGPRDRPGGNRRDGIGPWIFRECLVIDGGQDHLLLDRDLGQNAIPQIGARNRNKITSTGTKNLSNLATYRFCRIREQLGRREASYNSDTLDHRCRRKDGRTDGWMDGWNAICAPSGGPPTCAMKLKMSSSAATKMVRMCVGMASATSTRKGSPASQKVPPSANFFRKRSFDLYLRSVVDVAYLKRGVSNETIIMRNK